MDEREGTRAEGRWEEEGEEAYLQVLVQLLEGLLHCPSILVLRLRVGHFFGDPQSHVGLALGLLQGRADRRRISGTAGSGELREGGFCFLEFNAGVAIHGLRVEELVGFDEVDFGLLDGFFDFLLLGRGERERGGEG
jgi:hypothetical protein